MVNGRIVKVTGAVMIIAVLLAVLFANNGLLYTQTQTMDYDEGASTSEDAEGVSTFTASMYAYDEDGNKIDLSTGELFSAFKLGEAYIDSLAVGIWWKSEGEGIDWSTFNLNGKVTAYAWYYINEDAEMPTKVKSHEFAVTSQYPNNASAEDPNEYIFNCGTEICKVIYLNDGGTSSDYWILTFEVTMTADVKDEIGLPLGDTLKWVSSQLIISWDVSYDLSGGGGWT